MRILITNDDGVRAPGLRHLALVAAEFGEVKVVAPDRERSACAHSMTMREPLRLDKVEFEQGIEAYEVNGVPVDCVNVGLHVAWPEGCDLILSGINPGPNLGYDITYSGTAAGAMEAAINGIFGVAVSMATLQPGADPMFETGTRWLREHWNLIESLKRFEKPFWNINVPAEEFDKLKGYRFAAMGQRVYEDRIEHRKDPWDRPYYWQGGVVAAPENARDTDIGCVLEGYVSVTPVSVDWTDYRALNELKP